MDGLRQSARQIEAVSAGIVRTRATALVKGEAQLGITYAHYITQVKGPLSHVDFDKLLTDSTDLGLSAKAAAPNAAKLYIDYFGTADVQEIIAESGDFPIAPGIYPNLKDAEKTSCQFDLHGEPIRHTV